MKILLFIGALTLISVPANGQNAPAPDTISITDQTLVEALRAIGLEYTQTERDSMLADVRDNLESYQTLRRNLPDNSVAPALYFNPLPRGFEFPDKDDRFDPGPAPKVALPENRADLAFYTVRQLGELVRTRRITSTELTEFALERLKKHDPQLHCVITLTEAYALERAAKADSEIAAGHYRGPLHGIPYGAKDLLAFPGYRTTWGAGAYREQVKEETATVIQKLDSAGAILVAKLTLGALAWGDVWFGDTTRNPWNIEQGSSGSSAGSASAVSAGLVPFAIGTETWGSIVSPSTRCGVTGLRPTFGRVSRAGAMALSWSMDKIGPICRAVEDCAIVFDAMRGRDGLDPTAVSAPFDYNSGVDLSNLRIGYLADDFLSDTANTKTNSATIKTLRGMGVDLREMKLPQMNVNPLAIILVAEAAAAFQELTLSGRDDLLVRQIRNAWPNVFRTSQLIPAVEYIQANRWRTLLIEQMERTMDSIDVYLAPSFAGANLLLTNLTGHPCVVLPNGFRGTGEPTSVTFIGKLFSEGALLAVARAYQNATDFHKKHPPLFSD